MNNTIEYTELNAQNITEQTISDINQLLPQLAPDALPVTSEWVITMLSSGTRAFVAASDAHIVGIVLLCQTIGIAGKKDWIEDVVTDEKYRGQGIASKLLDMAEMASEKSKSKSINLTSKPARVGARKLYITRGYHERDTGVYRKTFQ